MQTFGRYVVQSASICRKIRTIIGSSRGIYINVSPHSALLHHHLTGTLTNSELAVRSTGLVCLFVLSYKINIKVQQVRGTARPETTIASESLVRALRCLRLDCILSFPFKMGLELEGCTVTRVVSQNLKCRAVAQVPDVSDVERDGHLQLQSSAIEWRVPACALHVQPS